jgi:uncharacterized protein (TIGR02118 family)
MIRASAIYPNTPGTRFDWDYYMNKHIPAVRSLAKMGLVRVEVDKGIGSAQPGAPAPFLCMAHMYFNTMEDMQKCMAGAAEMMADIPNFTDIQPQLQISEIV